MFLTLFKTFLAAKCVSCHSLFKKHFSAKIAHVLNSFANFFRCPKCRYLKTHFAKKWNRYLCEPFNGWLRNYEQADAIIEWVESQFCTVTITEAPGLFFESKNVNMIAITGL